MAGWVFLIERRCIRERCESIYACNFIEIHVGHLTVVQRRVMFFSLVLNILNTIFWDILCCTRIILCLYLHMFVHKATFLAVVLGTCMLQFEMTRTLYDCSHICPNQIMLNVFVNFSFPLSARRVVLFICKIFIFHTCTCTHKVRL